MPASFSFWATRASVAAARSARVGVEAVAAGISSSAVKLGSQESKHKVIGADEEGANKPALDSIKWVKDKKAPSRLRSSRRELW